MPTISTFLYAHRQPLTAAPHGTSVGATHWTAPPVAGAAVAKTSVAESPVSGADRRFRVQPGSDRAPGYPVSTEYVAWTQQLVRPLTSGADAAGFRQMMSDTGAAGWAAADGVYSIDLADGRVLWTYGDTMVNTIASYGSIIPNGAMVRNSAVIQQGNTATMLTRGTQAAPMDFLVPAKAEEWYWPGHGAAEHDAVTVFMGRYKSVEGKPGWTFGWAGTDMLVLDRKSLALRQRIELPTPTDRNVTWGMYVVEHDKHAYIYGMESGAVSTDRWAVVARAQRDTIHQGRWEYWDGSGWSRAVDDTARISDHVSNQFSVVKTRNGFALLSQQPYFGLGLLARTSANPQGPWSDWKLIDPGPTAEPNQISYNAVAHPQFVGSDKLLVGWSMNLNNGTLPLPTQNHLYQPRFRSIDRSLLESS